MLRVLSTLAVGLLVALAGCGSPGAATPAGGAGRGIVGSPCATVGDCQGALPASCLQCADGSAGCAHFVCEQGTCQVAYCPAQPAPPGSGCCVPPMIEQGGACCPACVVDGCMAPCYVEPACSPPPAPGGGAGSCAPGWVETGCACCPPCVRYGCAVACEAIPGCT